MSKTLVVYYSWTGNTAKLARVVADSLGADIEEIKEIKPRGGLFTQFRCVYEILTKAQPKIAPTTKRIADYEVVVLAFPVWVQNIAAPVRSYVTKHCREAKILAACCTLGSFGGEDAMEKLEEAAERKLAATLIVDAEALEKGDWKPRADAFARGLKLVVQRGAGADAA